MKRQMSTPLCRKLRHHRSYKSCALALSAAFLLGACGQSVQGNAGTSAAGTEEAQAAESGSTTEQTKAASGSGTAEGERLAEAFFSERDFRTEYDASSAVKISFEGSSAGSSDEKAAVVSGSTVTITDEGCYILSGNLTDGQLIIDAEKSDKIQLVLNGVTLYSESSAAIYVKQADKVFLTTAEGTENTLSNGGSDTAIDENAIDAVIFSKDDLTLNGEGKLTIRAEAGHGIVSKDSLAVTSGVYEITAAEDGMSGKDGVGIAGGTIEISAGDDGIHSDGAVYLIGGTIDITESEEGIEGATIDVLDGEVSIVSRDDGMNATNGTSRTVQENAAAPGQGARPSAPPTGGGDFAGRPSDSAENGQDRRPPQNGEAPPERGGRPGMGGQGQQPFSEAEEGVYISISGGTIRIAASGDGIDSNGDLYVSGGEVYISGPENDGNGSLDYNGEGIISGGVLAAAGSSGMAQRFSEASPQRSLLIETGENPAGTELTLYDSTGRELLRWTAEKAYSCVIVSLPSLTEGESYTLKSGDSEKTIVLDGSASTR
ncbi:MAG: carbohydrate-binding domain-containing protein [Oribacterium sp.]